MKKKIVFALLLAGMSFLAPNVADAQENELLAPKCGMVIIDCEGLGTGNWVACLKGGGGSCDCGSSTGCQGGWW